LLLLLTCLIVQINALQIRCFYNRNQWYQQVRNSILCDVKFLKSTTPWETFEEAKINYSSTNSEVKCIAFFRMTVNYIPSGLEMIFPDLREIYIQESNVLRIDQLNFKPITELESLSIRANRYLEVLERGLFDYNKKLKYINLYYNNFKHIDADLVSGLSLLKFFELELVTCISMTISESSMAPFKDKVKRKCQNPVVLQRHDEIVARQNFHRELGKQIQNFKKQIQNESKQMKQKDERNQITIKKFNKLHDDINSLSKQVSELPEAA